MFTQLLVGSLLVCMTIVATVAFIGVASAALSKVGGRLVGGRWQLKFLASLALVVLWLLGALTVSVWIWAAAFLQLGLFVQLEESLYFSVVSFTTLGYGDVTIDKEWRLLSGVIAANGLILFSLVTAYLIEFIGRVRKAAIGTGREGNDV